MATGRISNETRRTILEMSASGHSSSEIAEAVGRNESSVARIIEGSAPASKAKGKKKKKFEAPVPTPAPPPARKRPTGGTILTHHF